MNLKKLVIAVLTLSMVFGVLCISAYAAETADTWDGTADTSWYDAADPQTSYTIDTAEELAGLAKLVNEGTAFYEKELFKQYWNNVTFTLTTDIDLGNKAWTPIGNGAYLNGQKFAGNFDGGNHTISNLNVTGVANAGLFGSAGASGGDGLTRASIKNLTINNVTATGTSTAAAFVGNAFVGVGFDNLTVTGLVKIESDWVAGGITAYAYTAITNCSVNASEGSTIDAYEHAGGVIGLLGEGSGSKVENATASSVAVTAETYGAGGICGWSFAENTIKECAVESVVVDSKNSDYVGAVSGGSLGTTSTSNATLAVTTQSNGTPVAAKDAASTLPVVAKVGTTPYTSLQAAIDDAGATDEIVLMDDVTLPSDTRYAKPLTINLNSNTLYVTSSVTFNANATVYNGTINADGKYAPDGIIRLDYHVGASVQVTLRDLTVSALNAEWSTGVFNLHSDDDTLILDNVDVIVSGRDDDPGSGVFYSPSSFERGLVELKNNSTVTADNVNAVFFANDLSIDSATITASNIHRPVFRQADGTVENSTVTVDSPEEGVALVADVASNNSCSVEFVNSSISIPADMQVDGLTKENSEMSIAGGTTSFDPANWCADNYVPIQNEDGSYGVHPDAETFNITATVSPAEFGTVTGTGLYALDQTATLTAVAPEGYRFVKWTENGVAVSTDLTISFTVSADRQFIAVFEQDPTQFWLLQYLAFMQKFTVNASATEGGTISPAGETSVKYGGSVTFTLTPDAGYRIKALLVNGEDKGALSSYTAQKVTKNLIVTAVFEKVEEQLPFADLEKDAWYYEDVAYVYAAGLMNGTDKGFEPTLIANRAMLVTTLWRLAGEPAASASDFTDVKDGEWYTAAINWAAENKIVNGYEGKFDPVGAITREQVVAILNRYADFMNYESKAGAAGDYTVSDWAKDNVAWANANSILDGITVDITDMTAEADRAEIAAYLARFAKAFVK